MFNNWASNSAQRTMKQNNKTCCASAYIFFFFFWSFRQWRETQRQWIHFMFKGWGALRVMQKSMPQINWLYICMTKQLEEKQLPYPPHMPLKTQPLKRCIMKVDEACSGTGTLCAVRFPESKEGRVIKQHVSLAFPAACIPNHRQQIPFLQPLL